MLRNSVDSRLNRNTFYSGTEVAPVQCARGLSRYILEFSLVVPS